MMRYLKRSKRQAIARGKEINISSKAFLANNCNPLEALEAERDEARQVARRLLRERDEAREEVKWAQVELGGRGADIAILRAALDTADATIQHLESDRDALAAQLAEQRNSLKVYEENLIDANREVNRLDFIRDELAARNLVLTDLCTTIETERMNMRAHLVKMLETNLCPECHNPGYHADDCKLQVALGLAKGDIAPNTSLETQLRDEIERLETENAELRRVIEIPKWGGWSSLSVCPWCFHSGIHSYDCPRQKILGLKL